MALRHTLSCFSTKLVPNLGIRGMSSKLEDLVDLQTDKDGICTLTMQRPSVNSLNLELLKALNKSLDEIKKDGIKGMVLTSAFPTVFSAGIDINEAYQPKLDRLKTHWSTLQNVWLKLFGSDFITAAAINGHAPAGGCILATACEYRVMVHERKIGLNDTIIGFVPPKWVIESMRHAMRSSREAEFALTSSIMYTTEEAFKVGLIDEQADTKEEAIEKCKQFVKKFDKIPSFARIRTKKALRDPILKTLLDNREEDLDHAVKKTLDERTQKAVGYYFRELKERKKQ